VDGVHEEGATEAIGDDGYDAGRHCYAETLEVHAPEHQPRIGEVVNVSLVVKGRRLLTVRTHVSNRKLGPTMRERDGSLLTREARPYEKAFGCLKTTAPTVSVTALTGFALQLLYTKAWNTRDTQRDERN
jgi:hypothetical protein